MSPAQHRHVPDHLSATLSALADPNRRAILARLAQGPAPVGSLAAPLGLSLPATSKHLTVLERAGLVSRHRRAQWRDCRLEAAPLRELAGWLQTYRRFWDDSMERLHTYLEQLQSQPDPATGDQNHHGR